MKEIARQYSEYERRLNEICTDILGVPSRVIGKYRLHDHDCALIEATCSNISEYKKAVEKSLKLYALSDADQLALRIEPSGWLRFIASFTGDLPSHIARREISYKLNEVAIVKKYYSRQFDFVVSDKTGAIACALTRGYTTDANFSEAIHTIVGDSVELTLIPVKPPEPFALLDDILNKTLKERLNSK